MSADQRATGGPAAGVAARVAEVRAGIAAACARAGRDPSSVVLVGASKGQPVERLAAAFRAGVSIFGENRVQEAQAKAPLLPATAEWHLIGPLQSNKAKLAAGLFRAVHSIDRVKIARALDRWAGARGRRLPAFLEVNLGGEETKHGLPPGRLLEEARAIAGLDHLEVVGLMAIPPFGDDAEASRPWFRRLRELRDALVADPAFARCPGWLSMGMTSDFEVAIEEGATHVRIGTALFGPRGT